MEQENKLIPQITSFRSPTKEEQKVGMEMNAYIHQVLLAKKVTFFPYYSRDLKETFDMMNILHKINPELHKATAKKLDENGGMKRLLCLNSEMAAEIICKYLVVVAKELAEYRLKNS